MAKIRTIKPGFFQSEDVSALPLRARLTWIGLWTHCDDHGRAKDNSKLIKAAIWPLDDVSLRDVDEDLAVLADHGRIVRYEVEGKGYLEVCAWSDHQKIARPSASRFPPCPDSVTTLPKHGHGTVVTPQEGKGRERKGGANARPPMFCPKHPDGTSEPCRACGDARRAHDTWKPTVEALPTAAEALAETADDNLDEHGFPPGRCPICRRDAHGATA